MSEIEYKILLLGDSGIGKEYIFKILSKEEFNKKNVATIGIDRRTLSLNIDIDNNGKKENKNCDVFLFDTAGQERYKSITKTFLEALDGIILLYSITNKKSFLNVETWMNNIKDLIGISDESKIALILLGNKTDFEEGFKEREVTEEEAIKLCKQNNLIWGGEQNLKNMDKNNIEELFKEYTEKIYKIIGEKIHEKKMLIKSVKYYKQKKKQKCICF